ncbi:hypothetical protein LTR53_008065 [Teratosphaeriaceae sp. CCFEE 6253]|nr:hypothetical protein LTR53_008065 [Teratosphaeriaceae sp. CCFEE 6253]
MAPSLQCSSEVPRSESASPSTNRDALSFFSLAPELRNLIYAEFPSRSAPTWVTRKWTPELRARVHDLPDPRLLLLSRRFTDEYRPMVDKRTTLVVQDHLEVSMRVHPIMLGRLVARITALELDLFISTPASAIRCNNHGVEFCSLYEDLRVHHLWISDLVSRLPRLETVALRTHVLLPSSILTSTSPFAEHFVKFAALPCLVALTVFVNPGLTGSPEDWDYACVRKPALLQWEQSTCDFTAFTGADRGIFPFFALPRELRNLIYSAVLVGRGPATCDNNTDTAVTALHLPHSDLLVISRSFNAEYREASRTLGMSLMAKDYSSVNLSGFAPVNIAPSLLLLRKLEINFCCYEGGDCASLTAASCMDCVPGLDQGQHLYWMLALVRQMSRLQDLTVKLHLVRKDSNEGLSLEPAVTVGDAAHADAGGIGNPENAAGVQGGGSEGGGQGDQDPEPVQGETNAGNGQDASGGRDLYQPPSGQAQRHLARFATLSHGITNFRFVVYVTRGFDEDDPEEFDNYNCGRRPIMELGPDGEWVPHARQLSGAHAHDAGWPHRYMYLTSWG